jgi:hypothetical protein
MHLREYLLEGHHMLEKTIKQLHIIERGSVSNAALTRAKSSSLETGEGTKVLPITFS